MLHWAHSTLQNSANLWPSTGRLRLLHLDRDKRSQYRLLPGLHSRTQGLDGTRQFCCIDCVAEVGRKGGRDVNTTLRIYTITCNTTNYGVDFTRAICVHNSKSIVQQPVYFVLNRTDEGQFPRPALALRIPHAEVL